MLHVLLENDVKDKHSKYEGVFTFQGFSGGIDYWVDDEGENAIWYKASGSTYYWHIGRLVNLGTGAVVMYSSSNTLEKKCPNNEGYVWNWIYGDGYNWIATDDVYIKCANEDDFCTTENPCITNQGDCDTHDECQDGFSCGSNNCLDSLGFHSEFDCCYHLTVGDEDFCTTVTPCGEDEGDCDVHNECVDGLACGSNNCPASLGYGSEVECCTKGKIRKLYYLTSLNLCDCMFIAAVICDESGTMVAASCNLCPYEFLSDEYYYEYYHNDGTYCNGDCSWNSDLDECQIRGIF